MSALAWHYPGLARKGVLWFGAKPTVQVAHEFRTRGLRVIPAGLQHQYEPSMARGAVFSYRSGDETTGQLLAATLPSLLDHGIKVCLEADTDQAQGELSAFIAGDMGRHLLRRTSPETHEIAQGLAEHDPGPPARAAFLPSYASNVEHLRPEDTLLLGRALHDTGDVVVDDLGGGLSKARVLFVRTTYGNSIGSWAQPFFAKIDRREKILCEVANYGLAAPFVPFGLLPNIERVVCGHARGLLLGNLVSASEPLWDAARRGQADQVIFNLFNTTLRAWREVGLRSSPRNGSVLLACSKAGVVDKNRIRAELLPGPDAQSRHCLDRLWAGLSQFEEWHRVGTIHGDLHANNVRVRGTDAILIDLASACEGPLVVDFALLETWLAFALHRDDATPGYNNPEWAKTVEFLYSAGSLLAPPPPLSDPYGPYAWLWQAVSVIRALALHCRSSAGEYRTAVIAALLRRAMFPCDSSADRFRRKTAVELAFKLGRNALGLEAKDAG
jgi:Phosphotransferase enzyme family